MKPDYRNWMPRGMIMGLGTAAGVLAAGSAAAVWSRLPLDRTSRHLAGAVLGLGAVPVLRGRHGACTPGRCFPMKAGGSCPGRSWRVSPHTSRFRRAVWAWMWGAYFSVQDAEKELTSWSNRIFVSSRGYMLGYQDLWGPGIRNIHRLLARIADGPMKLQIVRLDFREDSR